MSLRVPSLERLIAELAKLPGVGSKSAQRMAMSFLKFKFEEDYFDSSETLEYEVKNGNLKFRYTNIIENFDMPIRVNINGSQQWLFPKAEWKTMSITGDDITIDENFLVYSKKL